MRRAPKVRWSSNRGCSRRRSRTSFRPAAERLEARELLAGDTALGSTPARIADATGPVIKSIQAPAAKTYGTNAALTFRVIFNEPVKVTGSPTLPVDIGLEVQQAALVANPLRIYSRSLVFRTKIDANSIANDGITLGTVGVQNGTVVQLMNVAGGIEDRAGNAADPVIPANVNTKRILVDAVGPVVQSYGFKKLSAGTLKAGRQISVVVKFDQPVTVTGRPIIPFSIGGLSYDLRYAKGSGTRTLLFTYRMKSDVSSQDVTFTQGVGEAIYMPEDASIKDRRGNEPDDVLDQYGNVLKVNGDDVVVLGAYYQFIGEVGIAELDNILNVQNQTFLETSNPHASYVLPTYQQAEYAVKLYKVTYNSVIPEQGNRPTTATGLVAIPIINASDASNSVPVTLPMVSYQHGTVYGSHEVPSYAFSANPNSPDFMNSYETRLAVAQFAGQGYVVIAADYFGMGDSTEPEAYTVKGSEQQACLDMLRQSSGLIRSQNVEVSNLLLSGWSQGGLVTMAFLQKLEQVGINVTAASTASAPSDVLAATSSLLFNSRGPSDPVPDAFWINSIFIIAAFSYEKYDNKPGLAFNFLNPQYYEACRELYTRDYNHLGFDRITGDILLYPTSDDTDPLTIPSNLTQLIRPQYFNPSDVSGSDPQYFPFSEFANLLQSASAYQWVINTPVQLNYGTNDEAFSTSVALIPYNYQETINKNNPIIPVEVSGGTHRGTFLTAVSNQLYWFNELLGRVPGPEPEDLLPS